MPNRRTAPLLIVALAGSLLTGCAATSPSATAVTATHARLSVPAAAKDFVSEYGGRYGNTATAVATYYAEAAAEKDASNLYGITVGYLIKDNDLAKLESQPVEVGTGSGPLGYISMDLPLDTPTTNDVLVPFFNTEPVSGCFNMTLNFLARNPAATDYITKDFNAFCAQQYGRDGTPYGQNLLDTLKSVVTKYGPAAYYKVLPIGPDETKNSPINQEAVTGGTTDGTVIQYDLYSTLRIQVETFDQKGTATTHVVDLQDTNVLFNRSAGDGHPESSTSISVGLASPARLVEE